MKRIILLSILLSLLAGTAQAAPHWYKDKKWWAGAAVIAGSIALDVQSTCRVFGRGYAESNPILRGSTNCGQIAGVATAYTAGMIGFHALAWHCESGKLWHCRGLNQDEGQNHKAWQTLSYTVFPAINAAVHIPSAVHNYRLPVLIPMQTSLRSGLSVQPSGPTQTVGGK